MPASIESLTTAALSLALRAASLRQQAGAANVANAGTQGYQPLRVAFEESLAAARAMLRERGSVDAASLAGARVDLEYESAAWRHNGSARTSLDAEVAALASNAVHYQALTQALSRHLGLLATAAADGRR